MNLPLPPILGRPGAKAPFPVPAACRTSSSAPGRIFCRSVQGAMAIVALPALLVVLVLGVAGIALVGLCRLVSPPRGGPGPG